MRDSQQEFRCRDNYSVDALIILLIFGCIVLVSTILGVVCGIAYGKITFIMDGLIIIIIFGICGIGLIILCGYALLRCKTTVFTINDREVKLIGKKMGKDVCIERNIENIQRIVIKIFRKIKVIVLVDNIGKMGRLAASQNGEYIKIQYSRNRLNAVKKFLLNCPIEISHNTELGES